ncbi:unnamed protein product [Thelazia callipaeda]|uniref:Clr2_transil domain-containing protein n=1 Tax=Thelazia callipaeda TaxID=103827 RepID=A0A0N5CPC0_THECL|nr:unnamed protein product [Thelazia callipaeda]
MNSQNKTEVDKWADQVIGAPLINNPVTVPNQQNMYIARYIREGFVYFGKAWDECGGVQCEFAYGGKKLKGSNINGKIQILTYDGNHITTGFFYEWIQLAKWLNHTSDGYHSLLCCGHSNGVIFWPQKSALGTLNTEKNIATFVCNGKVISLTVSEILEFLVLVRNTRDRPLHCLCGYCQKKNSLEKISYSPARMLMVNEWADYHINDTFPTSKHLIKALNRPLNTLDGPQDQYVALWYHFGTAVMGRAWNNSEGKIAAAFVRLLHLLLHLKKTNITTNYIFL